jgi:hypothetical protein
LLFWPSQKLQGNQVIKKVTRTKYNLVFANRPIDNTSGQKKSKLAVSVGFITVDRFKEDSDKKEYKFFKKYRQVSIVSIADIDRIQVEKKKGKE